MSERRIEAFYDTLRTQDIDGIVRWFTPAAKHRIYSASLSGQNQFAGEWDGADAIRSRFATFRDLWRIERLTVSNLVLDGVKGAARIALAAQANSGFRTLSVSSLHFLTFEAERIAEFEVFINDIAVERTGTGDLEPGPR